MRADSGFYTGTPWSPSAAGWIVRFSDRHPPARPPAESQRSDNPKMPGRRFLTGWTAPPMWPRPPTPHSRPRRTHAPVRLIVLSGEAGARFSTGSLRHLQLSRLRHRPGRGDAGTGGRSSPSRRDRECDTRPQVRRGAEPSPLGPLRRQRRLAGGTGDGAQTWPAGQPASAKGQPDRHHQDPQTTGLCLGRTDHPLGTPIDPASSPALALGGAVQPRPGPTASHSTPSLTAPVRH